MIPSSILELGPLRQGSDRRTALDSARTLGQHAERLGLRRIWVAEHHNSPAVSTAATSVVVSHIAAATTTIRVGAGGVMLPNHGPYVIADLAGTPARSRQRGDALSERVRSVEIQPKQ
ncbi:LLM class flavin-dependent oxidoreductase [Pseudomonas sp. WHRI 8519]|uniref:LLM class flavin-dependent oxidoreductase n=1 Tax=Pseudomonas TaxID=286 RepID=UPI0032ED298C